MENKTGQIWVETVIYTLIGLAIIGILLAVATPKINEMRDGMRINEARSSLEEISKQVYSVQEAPGNKRTVNLKVAKGRFIIDSKNNAIRWIMESRKKYSEPEVSVSFGNLKALTKEGNPWTVELNISFPVNITYKGEDKEKELDVSPTPYKVIIVNNGTRQGQLQVDITAE